MADRAPSTGMVRWQLIALALIILLATAFRCIHLADNPGWDGDEGYNWSIATNLLDGHVQRFALKYTFVDHPPLFYLLGAALMKVWTTDLIALRALSVTCGVLTCVLLFALGSKLRGPRLGLIAAAVFALWPQAVIQNRWAYTYNMLAMLEVAALWTALVLLANSGNKGTRWAAVQPQKNASHSPEGSETPVQEKFWSSIGSRFRKALVLVPGFLAGCAVATDQEGLSVVISVVVLAYGMRGLRLALVSCLSALVVPFLYLIWMLLLRGDALLFDIQHTAGRVGGGGPVTQGVDLLARLIHLWQFDALTLLGMLGLLLLPAGVIRRATLIQLLVLLILALKVRDPNPYFRAAIPLLPLLALGAALALDRILEFIWEGGLKHRGSRRMATAALLCFAVLSAGIDADQALAGYTPAIASGLPLSTKDARVMASWVNARVRPTDYTIAMPQIAWLLHGRTGELLEAVAISGHGTEFYPDGLGPSRFAYNTKLEAARFLIVDRFTTLWISGHPRERALVNEARQHWQIVYHHGEYIIYANPNNALPTN